MGKVDSRWLRFIHKDAAAKGLSPDGANELSIEEQASEAISDREIKTGEDVKQQISFLNMRGERNNFVAVMSEENISMVIGKSKSKKSYFTNQVIAALISNKEIDDRIWGNLPEDRRKVVVIDTEQSKYHVNRRRQIIEMGADEKDFDNLKVFHFAGLDVRVMVTALHMISEMEDVGVILIDQIGDLVSSINSEDEVREITIEMTRIINAKKMHIIVILHQNKGNEHAAGWIGTHLLKKCESVITVEKTSNTESNIKAAFTRNEAFEDIGLEIQENGQPKLVDPKEYADAKF